MLPYGIVFHDPRVGSTARARATIQFHPPEVDGHVDPRAHSLGGGEALELDVSAGGSAVESQLNLTDRLTLPLDHGTHTLAVPADVTAWRYT